jgi:type VI secretion system protein ImpK
MTLLELCEPLFQYVCRLLRLARTGRAMEMDKVRNDIARIFSDVKATASISAELATQYEKVELPLIFFIDFVIKESKLSFARDWLELSRERNELAGDEKFFDLLDVELADPSDAATERLVIFYTCIGLGFTGIYAGQPQKIQRLTLRISARISDMMDADENSYICPEVYENVDSRDFTKPPGKKLVAIVIALIGLIVIWALAYCYLFGTESDKVEKYLKTIDGFQVKSPPKPSVDISKK